MTRDGASCIGWKLPEQAAVINQTQYPSDDDILSVSETCQRLGVSRSTLWRVRRQGHFPTPIQISLNRIGFRRGDVRSWIESKRAEYG